MSHCIFTGISLVLWHVILTCELMSHFIFIGISLVLENVNHMSGVKIIYLSIIVWYLNTVSVSLVLFSHLL